MTREEAREIFKTLYRDKYKEFNYLDINVESEEALENEITNIEEANNGFDCPRFNRSRMDELGIEEEIADIFERVECPNTNTVTRALCDEYGVDYEHMQKISSCRECWHFRYMMFLYLMADKNTEYWNVD